jgi:hypothetical protein
MRVVVVKAGAIAQHEVALDLLKRKRTTLIELEIRGFVGVL